MIRISSFAALCLLVAGCLRAEGAQDVSRYDFEWGGQTADGIFFWAHVPAVQVRAAGTRPLWDKSGDLGRALAAAVGANCAQGDDWVPMDENTAAFFNEGHGIFPGDCEPG